MSLTVTNKSKSPLKIDYNRFSVTADNNPGAQARPMDVGFANPQFVLEPGKSQSGKLSFRITLTPTKEPKLVLKWQDGDQLAQLNLNSELKKLWKTKTTLVGPNDCLAIVELHRAIDHAAIWRLTEEFQSLKRRGIDRVVLDVVAETKPASSYTLRLTVGGCSA